MTYLFYSLIFTVIISGTGKLVHLLYRTGPNEMSALYLTRSRWIPLIPVPDYIYHRLPSSFTADLEAGLSSSQFDLAANVAGGDSRGGLDQKAKREVRKIMKNQKVDFDEARRIYTEQRFAKNNIGPDGRPRDPKFVSFS
jgi:hypothetical protein